jgi:hypothetical protein
MSTPPPGWTPQQQQGFPPQQPPGWSQQQQQPPPGYPLQQPPPGWNHPRQPPKKSKAPLVVALVVGLIVVLGGGGAAAYFYTTAHRDQGRAATGDTLPDQCAVSEQTLQRARTTNPNALMSKQTENFTSCDWLQTKGRDGEGNRALNARIDEYRVDKGSRDTPQGLAEAGFNAEHTNFVNARQGGDVLIEPLPNFGDQAEIAVELTDSAYTMVHVLVRQGGRTLNLDYSGWDIGVFSPKRPDVEEMKAIAHTAAGELLAKF